MRFDTKKMQLIPELKSKEFLDSFELEKQINEVNKKLLQFEKSGEFTDFKCIEDVVTGFSLTDFNCFVGYLDILHRHSVGTYIIGFQSAIVNLKSVEMNEDVRFLKGDEIIRVAVYFSYGSRSDGLSALLREAIVNFRFPHVPDNDEFFTTLRIDIPNGSQTKLHKDVNLVIKGYGIIGSNKANTYFKDRSVYLLSQKEIESNLRNRRSSGESFVVYSYITIGDLYKVVNQLFKDLDFDSDDLVIQPNSMPYSTTYTYHYLGLVDVLAIDTIKLVERGSDSFSSPTGIPTGVVIEVLCKHANTVKLVRLNSIVGSRDLLDGINILTNRSDNHCGYKLLTTVRGSELKPNVLGGSSKSNTFLIMNEGELLPAFKTKYV